MLPQLISRLSGTTETEPTTQAVRLADLVGVKDSLVLSGDMIKPGAAVIDVGINRLPDGSLTGDVDFESVREVPPTLVRPKVAAVVLAAGQSRRMGHINKLLELVDEVPLIRLV